MAEITQDRIFGELMSFGKLVVNLSKYGIGPLDVLPAYLEQRSEKGPYWIPVWAYSDGDDVYYFRPAARGVRRHKANGNVQFAKLIGEPDGKTD